MSIQANCRTLLEEINGRALIVAATKYVDSDQMKQLFESGIKDVGENRVEDLLKKKNELVDYPFRWHFIGTLQSKKVKKVIHHIDVLHSLDRLSLAEEIEKRSKKPLDCFIQVNITGESSKHGFTPREVIPFLYTIASFKQIRVIGLMTMASEDANETATEKTFSELAGLQEAVAKLNFAIAPCTQLSMGMSRDYKSALKMGATHLRLGSILYRET